MNNYITGIENENGIIWVMGDSKELEYAKKIAKRHKHKIYKLVEITDHSQGDK